jgi:hypothetical protein
MDEKTTTKDKKIDQAGKASFPASDPTPHASSTSTELPGRPVDRMAPRITKEQIEQAQHGDGHHHRDGELAMDDSRPADHPDSEAIAIRQGTGPRAMVSVLLISLMFSAVAGVALLAYFTLS